MKDKMNKKEIEKIENKLTDIEVPDRVLDLARAEISQTNKVRKPTYRRLNWKYALSCVASLAVCLAIILPITLSSFDDRDNSTLPPEVSDGSQVPPSDDMPSGLPEYKFETLIPDEAITGSEPKPPIDNDGSTIMLLSSTNYTDGKVAVILKETYTVHGEICEVFVPYNTSFKIDILEQFKNFTDEFNVGSVKVSYKVNANNYIAQAGFNSKRYCFTGNFEEKAVFEEFCQYLFK